MAQLRHPHLVAVTQSFLKDGVLCILTEYVQGGSVAGRERSAMASSAAMAAIAHESAPAATAAGVGGLFAAAPAALADPVGDASKKLADASYPLLQQIDWSRSPALNKWLSSAAEGWSPGKPVAEAVGSTLKLGLAMDQKLVAASVAAHEKAVADAAAQPGLVTPLEDHAAVTESIARMFATVPADSVKAVFDTYSKVGLKAINRDWFASVNTNDAKASFQAFFNLQKQVLAAQQVRPLAQDTSARIGAAYKLQAPVYTDKLGAAAKELADASYPMLKKINWESAPVLTKWLGSSSQTWDPVKISAAVGSALKASAAMDPKLILQSVAAHDKALTDALEQPGLVTPLADHEAVTESIVRMLASAPPDTVKAVFDTFAEVGLKDLNEQWYSTMDAAVAQTAYDKFLALSEVVKAR